MMQCAAWCDHCTAFDRGEKPIMMQNYVRKRYGGRKALVNYMWGRIACSLGLSRKYTAINFSRVERIVFVCIGNVCRSPFAEHLVLRDSVLSGKKVLSCGIRTSGGTPANPQAIAAAQMFGIDLSIHTSTRLADLQLSETDLLIGMDPSNLSALPAHIKASGAQLSLLGVWGQRPCLYIQDPYGRCDEYFKTCYRYIKDSVGGLSVGFG